LWFHHEFEVSFLFCSRLLKWKAWAEEMMKQWYENQFIRRDKKMVRKWTRKVIMITLAAVMAFTALPPEPGMPGFKRPRIMILRRCI
jgi:hypothetical protein